MKASELRQVIDKLIAEHGDLPVGYYNKEYNCFYWIEYAEKREACFSDDSEELGERFFGLR